MVIMKYLYEMLFDRFYYLFTNIKVKKNVIGQLITSVEFA